MVNKCLYFEKSRNEFKKKVLNYCSLFQEIDQDKIDIYHSAEDYQITVWLFASDYVVGSFDNACNQIFHYIQDDLNIVCYDFDVDTNHDYCYKIIMFYDEISNESEQIISEILEIFNKYNKKIDIQYDDDSAYISWY